MCPAQPPCLPPYVPGPPATCTRVRRNHVFSGRMVQRWPRTRLTRDPEELRPSSSRVSTRRGVLPPGELESVVRFHFHSPRWGEHEGPSMRCRAVHCHRADESRLHHRSPGWVVCVFLCVAVSCTSSYDSPPSCQSARRSRALPFSTCAPSICITHHAAVHHAERRAAAIVSPCFSPPVVSSRHVCCHLSLRMQLRNRASATNIYFNLTLGPTSYAASLSFPHS